MVVVRAAHVLVQRQTGLGGDGCVKRALVQTAAQDGGDAFVVRRANGLGAGASGFQALRPILTSQAHEPQTGALTLLGVGTVFHLPAHHVSRGHPFAFSPSDELGRRPLQVLPV